VGSSSQRYSMQARQG